MTGTTKTIKMSVGQSLYDFTVNGGGSITLASNIAVLHLFTWTSTFSLSTFSFDNTGGAVSCSTNFVFATAGTFIAGKYIDVAGNLDISTITFTYGHSKINMTGSVKTLKDTPYCFWDLDIIGSTTALTYVSVRHNMTVTGSFDSDFGLTVWGNVSSSGAMTQTGGGQWRMGNFTMTAGVFVQGNRILYTGNFSETGGIYDPDPAFVTTAMKSFDVSGGALLPDDLWLNMTGDRHYLKLIPGDQRIYRLEVSGNITVMCNLNVTIRGLEVTGFLIDHFILTVPDWSWISYINGTAEQGTAKWTFFDLALYGGKLVQKGDLDVLRHSLLLSGASIYQMSGAGNLNVSTFDMRGASIFWMGGHINATYGFLISDGTFHGEPSHWIFGTDGTGIFEQTGGSISYRSINLQLSYFSLVIFDERSIVNLTVLGSLDCWASLRVAHLYISGILDMNVHDLTVDQDAVLGPFGQITNSGLVGTCVFRFNWVNLTGTSSEISIGVGVVMWCANDFNMTGIGATLLCNDNARLHFNASLIVLSTAATVWFTLNGAVTDILGRALFVGSGASVTINGIYNCTGGTVFDNGTMWIPVNLWIMNSDIELRNAAFILGNQQCDAVFQGDLTMNDPSAFLQLYSSLPYQLLWLGDITQFDGEISVSGVAASIMTLTGNYSGTGGQITASAANRMLIVRGNWTTGAGMAVPAGFIFNGILNMTGIGRSIAMAAGQVFDILRITGQVSTSYASSRNLTVPAGGVLDIASAFNITSYLYGAGTIQGAGAINHTGGLVSYINWAGAPVGVDYIVYGGLVECLSDLSLTDTLTIESGGVFSIQALLKVAGATYIDGNSELHQHPASRIAMADLFINDSLSGFAFKMAGSFLNVSGSCFLTNSSNAIFNEGGVRVNGTLDIGAGCVAESSGENTFVTIWVNGTLQGWTGGPAAGDIIHTRYWDSVGGAWDAGQSTVVFDLSGTVSMDPLWAFYRLRVPASVTLTMLTNVRVNWSLDISGSLVELPYGAYINTTNSYCLMANGTFDGTIYLRGMASAFVYVNSGMAGWVNIENQTDFSMGGLLRVVPQNCTASVRITQYTMGGDDSDVVCRWNITLSAPFSMVNYTFYRLIATADYIVEDPDTEIFSGSASSSGSLGFQLRGNGDLVLKIVPVIDQNTTPVTPNPPAVAYLGLSLGGLFCLVSIVGMVFSFGPKRKIKKRKFLLAFFIVLFIFSLFMIMTSGQIALSATQAHADSFINACLSLKSGWIGW